MEKAHRKTAQIIAAVLLALVALWASFKNIDGRDLLRSFAGVNWIWVAAAVAVSLVTVLILSWRWRVLLSPRENDSVGSLFRLNIVSQFFNIVMPGRIGDIIKAFLASRGRQAHLGFVLGTVAIEKIFDFLVFALLWAMAPVLFIVGDSVSGFPLPLYLVLPAALMLIFIAWKPRALLAAAKVFRRLLPARFREKALNSIDQGLQAFTQLRSPLRLALVIFGSFGVLGGQVLTNCLLFRAFGLDLPLSAGILVLLATQIINIPPSVPGRIGIFEFSVILALGVFPVTRDQSLSYAIMLHLVAYLPKIILGLAYVPGLDLPIGWRMKTPPPAAP